MHSTLYNTVFLYHITDLPRSWRYLAFLGYDRPPHQRVENQDVAYDNPSAFHSFGFRRHYSWNRWDGFCCTFPLWAWRKFWSW